MPATINSSLGSVSWQILKSLDVPRVDCKMMAVGSFEKLSSAFPLTCMRVIFQTPLISLMSGNTGVGLATFSLGKLRLWSRSSSALSTSLGGVWLMPTVLSIRCLISINWCASINNVTIVLALTSVCQHYGAKASIHSKIGILCNTGLGLRMVPMEHH